MKWYAPNWAQTKIWEAHRSRKAIRVGGVRILRAYKRQESCKGRSTKVNKTKTIGTPYDTQYKTVFQGGLEEDGAIRSLERAAWGTKTETLNPRTVRKATQADDIRADGYLKEGKKTKTNIALSRKQG